MQDDDFNAAAADIAQAPAPSGNPFDTAAASVVGDRSAIIKNNAYNGAAQNPEQVATHARMAKTLGVPIQSVQADPALAKQMLAAQSVDAHQMQSQFPNLAQYMTDSTKAAISHDDVPPMAATEKSVGMVPPPNPAHAAPRLDDTESIGGNLIKGLGSSFNQAAKAVNLAGGAFPTLWDKAASLMTGEPHSAASDWYFKNLVAPLDQNASSFTPGKTIPQQVAHGVGSLLGMLSQIELTGGAAPVAAETAATPVLTKVADAVGGATKTMAFPALSSAVNTGNDVYAQTGDAAAALKAAIVSHATNTAMGVLPMSLEGNLATRLATGAPVGALIGETNRQVMNWSLPQGMQQPFNVSDAIVNGLTGSILAGGMGHNTPLHEQAIHQAYADARKSYEAVQGGEAVKAVGELAAQAATRERSPENFKEFVQNVSDSGEAPKELWVDGNTLVDVLHQSGITPDELQQKMPDVASQIAEAQATNGDVRIPMADYATHIAGGAASDALLPHLKTDPDGMTYSQGQEHLANQQAQFTEVAKQLTEKQQERNIRDQQLLDIQNKVQGDLEKTGRYTPDAAKSMAQLHTAFYDNMSDRMGLTPEQTRLRYQLPDTVGESLASGYSQESRGGFNPDTRTISLNKTADLSTFLHESGHFFLEALHSFAQHPEAPQGIKNDFDNILQHNKVEGATPDERMANWTARDLNGKRDAHEQFAEGFEKYLLSGKAPVPAMQTLFSRFRSWLMTLYKNGLGGQLSPEIKGAMDRMFASQEAITEAERVRNYAVPDLPAGEMADQIKQLGKEATEQAIADMQAKSLRDMRWVSNAKSRAMKDLQRTAKEERAKIADEVAREVMQEPVNKARQWLTKGEMTDAEGNPVKMEKGFKLNTNDLRYMYPKDAPGHENIISDLHGMTNEEGMHPDLVADMFGYPSGKQLIEDLINAPSAKDKIEGMTDQRMLERHGELTDPVSIERAAEAAIHNEARARMMATGLKVLTKNPLSVNEINKAVKAAADTAINAKKISDLRPAQYSAAEAKANKELLKLAPKDPTGAAKAQREALLNNRLYKSANDAVQDVRAGLVFLKKFSKDSVRTRIDVDIRDQIDDLLNRFDLRNNPTDAPTRAQVNLEKWMDSQRAAGYEPTATDDMLNQAVRTPFREMTMEQFRGLVDTIKSMEHMGKERNNIVINGEKQLLNDYVSDRLIPKMKERGDNFKTTQIHDSVENQGLSTMGEALSKAASWLRSINAQLKPQEYKRNAFDMHEILGPFGESIFEPVMDANYNKVRMLKEMSDDSQEMANKLGRDWQDSLRESLENKTLPDAIASKVKGTPVMFRMTRGKMVGMAIHVGNESNFDKLTKGYGWEPKDVWDFLHKNMSEKDWQAVQHIWDTYDKKWPDMQAMYRRLGQTTPDKIEPRAFPTQFGEMRGGYAAIKYDALRSRRGEKEAAGKAIDPSQGLFGRDYFSRNSTTNGSMNKRMDGYTDAIDLNFSTIDRALQESIHDLAYREALINANKVIENSTFREQFYRTYGREDYQAMRDWLGRLANSNNTDRDVGALGRFLQYTRTGMVMNGIALRITTVLKHGGSAGIKTLGYFTGGGEKYLASRMASMATDYKAQIEGAKEKFGEINARLLQQDRDYRQTASSMFEPEGLRSRAERFGHAAVAWSDMMTAVPTAWAAYDRAITEGIPVNLGGTGKPMTEAQAVHYANKIVREAHGSNVESARSNVMTIDSEGFKMFTTLYGFMNNTYGQIADSVNKFQTPGISKPEVLARTFMALIVPALWVGWLKGEKDDKTGWAGFVGKSITGEVAGTVPFVRDAYSMVEGYRHAGQVGAESWMSTLVQPALDAKKAAEGKAVPGAISHAADAVGMGLHIPGLGQTGKSAQYMYDVHTGRQHPQDAADYARGVTIGAPHKK